MSDKPAWWTKDEWATPQSVVDAEVARGGPFDLDPCCRPETAKAEAFYTKFNDGLALPWWGRVWCNPPYSDPSPWVQRAVRAVTPDEAMQVEAREVVMLLPAATDTGWFHDFVLPYADIRFLRGRIKFLGHDGLPAGMPKGGSIMAYFPKRATR